MSRIQQVLAELHDGHSPETARHERPPEATLSHADVPPLPLQSAWQPDTPTSDEPIGGTADETRSCAPSRPATLATSRDSLADRHGIAGLHRQIEELEQRLAESDRQCVQLQQQLAEVDPSRIRESVQRELESALREQRVELERERAELDRQRTGLEYERGGLERSRQSDEVNERMLVLREHLREIHEREQQQRRGRGLSAWCAGVRERFERVTNRWTRSQTQPVSDERLAALQPAPRP
jgi:hypothetical protein